MRSANLVLLGVAGVTFLVACGRGGSPTSPTSFSAQGSAGTSTPTPKGGSLAFLVYSQAFTADQAIPSRFTCDGDDVSPVLYWGGVPERTLSFALIMDDADAPGGVFTHWVLYDIGANARSLLEGVEKTERPHTGAGAVQGRNDFGRMGYNGPCPPDESRHTYRLQLYALETLVSLATGASKQQLVDAMTGHILATGTLTGTYER